MGPSSADLEPVAFVDYTDLQGGSLEEGEEGELPNPSALCPLHSGIL